MTNGAIAVTAPSHTRRSVLKGTASVVVLSVMAPPAYAKIRSADDRFIDDLIAKMSIEEKAGQLSLYSDSTRFDYVRVNPGADAKNKLQVEADIAKGLITGLFNGIGVAGGRELQKVAVEQSRLGIPLIFAADIIHGARTVFPIPLGEAASFDTDLATRTARAAAVEATALGIHWTFAPMVDIARDERWGRVAEGAGEDTYLGCRFAEARVRGFQGAGLKDDDSLLACPKHFAAYGAVMGGMEYNTADIPETTLRQTHLPPFKAAFNAGAMSTMSSFNDIAGVPSTGNHHLLTDILRKEWNFKGLVVSDFTSEEELIAHGYAADGADATRKAITAGCDVSMQSGLYMKYLPQLVHDGLVPLAVVDEAVRRVLRVKKMLGLFDNPYRSLDPERETTQIRLPETVALAREAARRAVVLLKNDGPLLPLSKSGTKIALIGPFGADRDNLMGPWAVFPDVASGVTLEEGLRAAMADPKLLSVVKGSDIEAPVDGGIDAAVAAAKASDVVLLAIGEGADMSGEAESRVEICVPKPQQALAEAVASVGKPVVVLLRHGRAIALTGAVRDAQAIMATWFLGSETGHALADLVFGDVGPSGRLPVSFPQASGQEPFFYNHRSTGRPQISPADPMYKARYREVTNEALFPFGHGLTYGQVSYGATLIGQSELAWDGTLTVSAEIANAGPRPVHEVAQLYIRDLVASITQPVRALKGFRHLDLAPGESVAISFDLTRHDLAFVNGSLKFEAEPGPFEVWIAPSSVDGTAARFRLTADPRSHWKRRSRATVGR
ncbi:MAG: glycoside hydrolase family 3 C-terminal domain-containing protein [Alphaproteobacteria bacterium]|nr:glycoside hydrolase family 3 C-terminal domain-containing protein [Alphaproteobacteria bacterium]